MNKCKRCGSYAINPQHHGRDNTDLDLCDVCFWRNRAEHYRICLVEVRERLVEICESEQLAQGCDIC